MVGSLFQLRPPKAALETMRDVELFDLFRSYNLQVEPGKPGAEVSKGKTITRQRKNVPIECAHGDQPMRCPNRGFCVHQLVVAFWWWLVVFPWCAGVGDVMCCDVVCDVKWLAAR